MTLIARRGGTTAWADEPFDPAVDEVELRTLGEPSVRVRWQSVLKLGYWERVE